MHQTLIYVGHHLGAGQTLSAATSGQQHRIPKTPNPTSSGGESQLSYRVDEDQDEGNSTHYSATFDRKIIPPAPSPASPPASEVVVICRVTWASRAASRFLGAHALAEAARAGTLRPSTAFLRVGKRFLLLILLHARGRWCSRARKRRLRHGGLPSVLRSAVAAQPGLVVRRNTRMPSFCDNRSSTVHPLLP